MKKNVFFIFLCLLLVLPTFADDVTDVQTRVTQIQTTDPTLPSISEQKGIYGTILSKLFDGNGKIKDIFLQIVGSLSSGNVPRWDGSQLVSGVLTDDGTNVGIGFSGPQAPLDVQLTNGRIHVRDSDVSNGTIPMIGTNSSASTHLGLGVGNTPTVILTSGANRYVGIGDSTPSYKLDVNGNIRAQSQHLYLGSNDVYGDDSSALYSDSNDSTTSQFILRDAENTEYGRLYGANDGADFGLIDGDGNWGVRMNKDTYTSFVINNSEKMRITGSGNLGIGSTNPGVKLEVHAAGGDGISITASDYNFPNDAGDIMFNKYDGTQLSRIYTNPDDSSLIFSAGSTNEGDVNITADGNVGIANTSPTYLLDIGPGSNDAAIMRASSSSSSDPAALIFSNSGTNVGYVGRTGSSTFEVGAYDDIPVYILQNHGVAIGIDTDGNVGIGTAYPGEKLDVNGNIQATAYYYSSDRRLKENITPIDNGLSLVQALQGVRFDWKKDGTPSLGFIAQEVEQVLPELVSHSGEYEAVQYGNITAILVEAVKEQQQQIKKLQEEITSLKAQLGN